MSIINLYYHRKVNFITGISGYVETYHVWEHVINGTVTLDLSSGNWKFFQEEAHKRIYCNCKWQKNEDGYTVCGMCRGKLRFWDIWNVCFVQGIKKEKNIIKDIQIMKIAENMRAQNKLLNKNSKIRRISNHKQLSRYRNFLTKKN